MKILALETATEACSAALYLDGGIIERYRVEPRRHSELILGMMASLLDEAGVRLGELDALAFGRGPGSFTGVRIAVGVAQGVGFAAELPVLPVSTLAALAQGAYRQHGRERILAAYDARMEQVYWGTYEVGSDGLVAPRSDERVVSPEAVEVPTGGGWHGVGAGWKSYAATLSARCGEALASVDGEALCSAADLVLLGAAAFSRGEAVPAAEALPVYLRDRVASVKGG